MKSNRPQLPFFFGLLHEVKKLQQKYYPNICQDQEIAQNNSILFTLYLWILQKKLFFSDQDNFLQYLLRMKPESQSLSSFLFHFLQNLIQNSNLPSIKVPTSEKKEAIHHAIFWNPSLCIDSSGNSLEILDFSSFSDHLIYSDISTSQFPEKPSIQKIRKIFPEGIPLFTCFKIFEYYYQNLSDREFVDAFERLLLEETKKKTGAYYTPPYICEKIGRELIKSTLSPIFPSLSKLSNAPLLGEWIQEYFTQQDGALVREKLQAVHQTLAALKILDPALGAGHFLLALDEILINIYHTLWDLIQEKEIKDCIFIPGHDGSFRDLLDFESFSDVAHYLRLRILYPSIFYGIDINFRAIIIAKLRLFLKLWEYPISEPYNQNLYLNLPWNLFVGNSLIGWTTWDPFLHMFEEKSKIKIKGKSTITKKLTDVYQNAVNLLLTSSLTPIFKKASENLVIFPIEEVSILHFKSTYEKYSLIIQLVKILTNIRQYIKKHMSSAFKQEMFQDFTQFTCLLRNLFQSLYLEFIQSLEPKNQFTAFRSNQIFNWIVEFPEIFSLPQLKFAITPEVKNLDGFNLVIGNPPYGNLLTKGEKQLLEPNLGIPNEISSLFIHRASTLLKIQGSFAFLTSYTICFNKQLSTLRTYMLKSFSCVKMATFDRDRCRMFENMTQSVTILTCINKGIAISEEPHNLFTTQIYRNMPQLDRLSYQCANSFFLGTSIGTKISQIHRIPKIGTQPLFHLLDQLKSHFLLSQKQIGNWLQPAKIVPSNKVEMEILHEFPNHHSGIWIRISGNYWYNAWNSRPYFGTQIAFLPFKSPNSKIEDFLLCLINSSLYYTWFRVFSDGRHMNSDILHAFPLPKNVDTMLDILYPFFHIYSQKLMIILFDHFDSSLNRFNSSEIKQYLDVGDILLGIFYTFSIKEITFIQNFEFEIRGGAKLSLERTKAIYDVLNSAMVNFTGETPPNQQLTLQKFEQMLENIHQEVS